MVISYRRFIWGLHPCRGVPLAARGGLRGSPSTGAHAQFARIVASKLFGNPERGEALYRFGHRAADSSTAHARGNLMSDSFNLCLESAGTRGEGGDPVWAHMKWHFRQNGLSRLCHRK